MVSLSKKLTSTSRSHRLFLDFQAERIQPRYAIGSKPYQDYPAPNFRIENTKTLAIEISDLLSEDAERAHGNLRARLERTGSRLCDLVLGHELIEELRKEDSFSYLALDLHRSLAWIPWELIWDGDQFLCQRFCVARQLIRLANWRQAGQPNRALLPRALIALGDTSNLNPDPEAARIMKMLHELAHLDVHKSEPLRAEELKEHLKEGYGVLHFIGHGAYVPGDPHQTGLRCSDQNILTSTDLEKISVATKFPFLIFANACDSARPNLAEAEVYASELYEGFVRRGTENYIGTLARVPDDLSTEFAGSFYERLARGASLGESLGYARRRFFDKENQEIWAYYVHYGVPESRLLPESTPATWVPPLDERVRESLRQEELRDLRSALEQNRVVAVVGEPKIGKTSLVALLTGILQAEVGALILYYDLRLDNTAVILEQLLDRANIPVRGTFNENLSLLATLLGERRCCVVLDNFESALDENNHRIVDPRLSQLIDALLVARPASRSYVILTCRYPVRTQNYNSVPVFSLHGIAEQVAIPYLVQEYGWVAEDAKRIYEIRPGNPLVFHACSEAIQDRQRLGINFDDALRQVHTLGTKLTYGEYYESFTDVERFIVDIVALHPVGMSVEGIAHILRGEMLNDVLINQNVFRGIDDIVPAEFPYEDTSDIVVHLYRQGALAQTGGMLRLLPQDRSFVYNQVKGRDKWWLLHRLAAQYYSAVRYRFHLKTCSSRFPEIWATVKAIRDITWHEYCALDEVVFYHSMRGGLWKLALGALNQLNHRLADSKNYETLRQYNEELLHSKLFDVQNAYEQGHAYYRYAVHLSELGYWEETRQYLSKAGKCLEREEESRSRHLRADILVGLGLLARKLGDPPKEEIEFYERAMELRPDRDDRKFFEDVEIYLTDARKRLTAYSTTLLK